MKIEDCEPAVIDYARGLFPKISDELIIDNYTKLRTSYNMLQNCRHCLSLEMCPANTAGVKMILEMDPSGYIRDIMVPCGPEKFKRLRDEKLKKKV